MIKSMLIAGAGGFVGTCLRYLVGTYTKGWMNKLPPHCEVVLGVRLCDFPLGTFIVNVVGCLIIGLVFGLSEKTGILSSNHVLLLATGFCGGFTTFSAFANEALTLGTKGDWMTSLLYLAVSVVFGIICVWVGRALVIN